MIQRKQTLFLLQLIFLSISLLFVPTQVILNGAITTGVTLTPVSGISTTGHFAAIAINLLGLVIGVLTIFLFKNRELQVKLCYVLMVLYIVLPLMMAFCPFVNLLAGETAGKTFFGYIICVVAALSAFLAARFVKKDIELLKSADRIR